MSVGGKDSTWKHGTNGAPAVLTDFTTKTMSVQPSFDGEEIDMTVWGDGFRSFEQTFKNSTIQVTYKYDPTLLAQLGDLYKNGTEVDWELGPTGDDPGQPKISGEMFLKSLSLPVNVGDGLKVTANFRVTGAVDFDVFS